MAGTVPAPSGTGTLSLSSRNAPVSRARARLLALALRWPDVDLERTALRVRGTLVRIGGELLVTESNDLVV